MINLRHYCGATFQVSDGQEGNHVVCPGCRDMVRVPHAQSGADSGSGSGLPAVGSPGATAPTSGGSDADRYVPEGGRAKRNRRSDTLAGDELLKGGEPEEIQSPALPQRPSESLFNMFFERYRPAYSAARRLDILGRFMLGLAFVAGVLGLVAVFLGLGSLKKAGGADGFAWGLLVGPYILAAGAALGAAGAAARLRASMIRTQIDAALFVAPGLSAQEKIALAFSKDV